MATFFCLADSVSSFSEFGLTDYGLAQIGIDNSTDKGGQRRDILIVYSRNLANPLRYAAKSAANELMRDGFEGNEALKLFVEKVRKEG